MSDNSNDLVSLPNGGTATFHKNGGSYLRGYVYNGGLRVYGRRVRQADGSFAFEATGRYASLVAA